MSSNLSALNIELPDMRIKVRKFLEEKEKEDEKETETKPADVEASKDILNQASHDTKS